MGKPVLATKTHNYPAQRQSFACSKKGIGRWKRKVGMKKSAYQTYFDKLLQSKIKIEVFLKIQFIFKMPGGTIHKICSFELDNF